MKKWTFQKGLFVILVIIILLSTVDRYTGRNFFDVFFCLFLFVIGINIGLNIDFEYIILFILSYLISFILGIFIMGLFLYSKWEEIIAN